MKHLISTKNIDIKTLNDIFQLADYYKKEQQSNILSRKIIASIFYEPSTRTRLSFEAAALKLGAKIISTENASQFSSAAKGETLEDTIKIVSSYTDLIVLRHFEKGASKKAITVSAVPIINAGDGTGEHPTQAILDAYTIYNALKALNNLKIALVGDLLNGRTIHSLLILLSLYKNNTIYLVSPKELKLPNANKKILSNKKIKFMESENLKNILPKIDLLYMTRIQKERFKSAKDFEKVKNVYRLTKKMVSTMKKSSIVMHPLPRINEIAKEVDSDSRAAYFRQAQNGLFVRMAILELLLKKF